MNTVRVRYMVNDLDPAVSFYTKYLGFHVKQEAKPNFAMLSRGNLELVLSTNYGPGGAAKLGGSATLAVALVAPKQA